MTLRALQETFEPDLKPMIKNLQEKLHQGKRKQPKIQKFVVVLDECEKCSKTFCKIFGRQNMQNQTNTKHFSNPEDIFKSPKNFLGKRSPKEDSFKTAISKVLSKISNRKKTSKQQYNFCKAKISLEVNGI